MPIGGVMAAPLPSGIISPGSVGYDINCGVRLLASHVSHDEIRDQVEGLATALYRNCPSGVGEKGSVPLTTDELDRVCREGARWEQCVMVGGDLPDVPMLRRVWRNGCARRDSRHRY